MGKQRRQSRSCDAAAGASASALEDLDDALILMIMERAEFPGRPALAQASRRLRRLAGHPCFVQDVDGEGLTLIEAVERARPGDTLRLTSPFFQEAAIIDKPLRIVGAAHAPGCAGGQATLFQQRPPVVLAQARVLFKNVVLHTGSQRDDTSIAVLGPECPYMRFEDCRLLGPTGLTLPPSKDRRTRLELHDCELANVMGGCAALQVGTGLLVMRRCLVRNSAIGLEIGEDAFADLYGVQLQSNVAACHLDGSVSARDCAIWANASVGCPHTEARLQDAMTRAALRSAGPPLRRAAGGAGAGGSGGLAAAAGGATPATPAAALAAPGSARAAAAAAAAAADADGGAAAEAGAGVERTAQKPWTMLSPSISAWRSVGALTPAARGGELADAGSRLLAAAAPAGDAAAAAVGTPAAAACAAAVEPSAQPGGAGAASAETSPAVEGQRRRRRPRDGRALTAAAATAAACQFASDGGAATPGPAGSPGFQQRRLHSAAVAAAVAAALDTGGSQEVPLDPALLAAFAGAVEAGSDEGQEQGQYFEVVNLLVVPPEISYRSKAQKDVRKRMKALNEAVHGPSDNNFGAWEALAHSDLDSDDEGDEDVEVDSDEMLEQEDADEDLEDAMSSGEDSSGSSGDEEEEEEEEADFSSDGSDFEGGSGSDGGSSESDGSSGEGSGEGSEDGVGGSEDGTTSSSGNSGED